MSSTDYTVTLHNYTETVHWSIRSNPSQPPFPIPTHFLPSSGLLLSPLSIYSLHSILTYGITTKYKNCSSYGSINQDTAFDPQFLITQTVVWCTDLLDIEIHVSPRNWFFSVLFPGRWWCLFSLFSDRVRTFRHFPSGQMDQFRTVHKRPVSPSIFALLFSF